MQGTEAVGGELKYHDVNYSKLSSNLTGERYLNNLITSGRRGTGASFGNPFVKTNDITKPRDAIPSANNKEKIKCQYYFKGCLEALDRAITNFDDIFSRDNALDDLNKNLALLWEHRRYREEPYGDLINEVQTLLIEVKTEKITLDQLKVLLEVVKDASDKQILADIDVNEYLIKLSQTGYDISKGLR
jgi:hypothetical protein